MTAARLTRCTMPSHGANCRFCNGLDVQVVADSLDDIVAINSEESCPRCELPLRLIRGVERWWPCVGCDRREAEP